MIRDLSVPQIGAFEVGAVIDLVPDDLVVVPPAEPFPADGLIVVGFVGSVSVAEILAARRSPLSGANRHDPRSVLANTLLTKRRHTQVDFQFSFRSIE